MGTTVFVNLDNTKLELLHPLGEKSPIAGFLEKNKAGGIHHICIEVNDIHAAVADVKAENWRSWETCNVPAPKRLQRSPRRTRARVIAEQLILGDRNNQSNRRCDSLEMASTP